MKNRKFIIARSDAIFRDVKELYTRARAGNIKHFSGIALPYEESEKQKLIVDTGSQPVKACVNQVLAYLEAHSLITSAKQPGTVCSNNIQNPMIYPMVSIEQES